MRVLDLFSGIGGFSLGLERAGFETVAFCEIEKYPQKVLKKHWPDVPIYEDVRDVTAERLRADGIFPDVITGGFPCQPYSLAAAAHGKRKGQADDRDLWPQMFRIIQEVEPDWVLGENTYGIINMALDQVLSDLESFGYSSGAIIIPACAIEDASHIRQRVWILAHSSRVRLQGCSIAQTSKRKGITLKGEEATGGFELSLSRRNQKQYEPGVCRTSYGIPQRVDRLKGLGNAVVPQIPELIGRAIMEAQE